MHKIQRKIKRGETVSEDDKRKLNEFYEFANKDDE